MNVCQACGQSVHSPCCPEVLQPTCSPSHPLNIHFPGLTRLPLLFGSAYFNIHIDYSYIKGAQKYQSRTKAIIIMQP